MSSFHCPHCGTSNSSLQPGAAVEDRGVKYTFKVQEHEVHMHVYWGNAKASDAQA